MLHSRNYDVPDLPRIEDMNNSIRSEVHGGFTHHKPFPVTVDRQKEQEHESNVSHTPHNDVSTDERRQGRKKERRHSCRHTHLQSPETYEVFAFLTLLHVTSLSDDVVLWHALVIQLTS